MNLAQTTLALLAIKYDLASRKHRQTALVWSLSIVGLSLLLIALGNAGDSPYVGVIFVLLLFASGRLFFPWVRDDAELGQHLLLPAGEPAKWAAEWLHSLVLLPLAVCALVGVGVAVAALLEWSSLSQLDLGGGALLDALKLYAYAHPALFLSAVLFRRNAILKVLLAALVIGGVSAWLAVQIVFGGPVDGATLESVLQQRYIELSLALEQSNWKTLGLMLYAALGWGLAYLRLRELEL